MSAVQTERPQTQLHGLTSSTKGMRDFDPYVVDLLKFFQSSIALAATIIFGLYHSIALKI